MIPAGYTHEYYLFLTTFLYVLVPPGTADGLIGLPQAPFVVKKATTFVPQTCLFVTGHSILTNMSHLCLSGESQNRHDTKHILWKWRKRPELSYEPDWRPKRGPIFVNLLIMFGIFGTRY